MVRKSNGSQNGNPRRHAGKQTTDPNAKLEAWFNTASKFYESGNYTSAVDSLNKIQNLVPDLPDVLHFLGLIELKRENADEAVKHLRKLVGAVNNVPGLWVLYGSACKSANLDEEGMAAQKQALVLDPMFGDAHYNLGRSYFDKGDLDQAEGHLLKAISCDSKDLGAIFEYAKLLIKKEEFKQAEERVLQILAIDDTHMMANSLYSSLLADKGELQAATKHIILAIKKNPEDPEFFIQFKSVFKALERMPEGLSSLEISNVSDLRKLFPETLEFNHFEYGLECNNPNRVEEARRVLRGKLNRNEVKPLKLNKVSFNKSAKEKFVTPYTKSVALIHWGRSGSGFLHSLLDNHPQVSTLPSYYLGDYFGRETWRGIASSEPAVLVENFCKLHEVLFDAGISEPPPGFRKRKLLNFGANEGGTTMGPSRDQTLTLDREKFSQILLNLLAGKKRTNPNEFFQMVHVAFDLCLGRQGADLLFYHIHNPDNWSLCSYLRFQPNSKLLLSVREPLQSCESWVASKEDYMGAVLCVQEFLYTFGNIEFKHQDSRGIRLEDLKLDTERTLNELSSWLQIDDHENLRSPTFQGLQYWGDTSSIRFGRTQPVVGFGNDEFDPSTDPIRRKVGFLFSDRDQLILRTLLYPIRVLYRYQEPGNEQFVRDLNTIKTMLDEPMDFERKLLSEPNGKRFSSESNVGRMGLRNALHDRWETLDTFGTYPNMIKPLFDGNMY
jgi:tetratricopeptide (TPR) repeat protein